MILIIAEKPSLAADIAKSLGPSATRVKNDYFTCGNYVITWLFGHVLALKDPEQYDTKYADRSNTALLPIYFENWGMKIAESEGNTKADRVKLIGDLLKDAEYVIHAGDPDDEGQLLVDEVIRWHKYAGPVYRLDTGNTTKEALQKAMGHLKPNSEFEMSGWAAYARSVADFTVGINLSRFYSAKNRCNLAIGRVKMPTLGLVVQRDRLIEGHKEVIFYEVHGAIHIGERQFDGKYVPDKEDPHLTDGKMLSKEYAEEIRSGINGMTGTGTIVKKKLTVSPPLPFNLVKLQTFCSKKFGLSPAQTLEISQTLRTKYHAITYNRSDCQYLSTEHYKEAPKTIASTLANLGYANPMIDPKIKSKCFNDANITAHFAIIPSGASVDLSKMTKEEKQVYKSICCYYLMQFMPSAIKEKTMFSMPTKEDATITATSTVTIDPGFLSFMDTSKAEEKDTPNPLHEIPAGKYSSTVSDPYIQEKKTTPPARYTKATLNEDMTCIAKYVKDAEVKNLLLEKDKDKKGENGSIGTPATRTVIIDSLIQLNYIKEEGRHLVSTPMGREYFDILPETFKKPDMTAYWWVMQEDIKNKKSSPEDLCHSVLDSLQVVLDKECPTLEHRYTEAGGENDIGVCPLCGRKIIETKLSFSCSGYKDGCHFSIWKKPAGDLFKNIKISKTQAKRLLAGKHITSAKLFSVRRNQNFSGQIVLETDKSFKYGARLKILFK